MERCERKWAFYFLIKISQITIWCLFDVEHAGSTVEQSVGDECAVRGLLLVLPFLMTHVARVWAAQEKLNRT